MVILTCTCDRHLVGVIDREAEVSELDHLGLGQQDVFGLNIAVDDVLWGGGQGHRRRGSGGGLEDNEQDTSEPHT
jgi:hypothetical protein